MGWAHGGSLILFSLLSCMYKNFHEKNIKEFLQHRQNSKTNL